MDTLEPIAVAGPLPNTPDDLARRHRSMWAAAVCAGLSALELAPGSAAETLVDVLEGDGARPQAIIWLDGIGPDGPSDAELGLLRVAAESGARIVLALPAESRRPGSDAARAVAEALGGAVLMQRLAEGSLIHAVDDRPERLAASIEHAPVDDSADASTWLVTVNVLAEAMRQAEQAVVTLEVVPVHGAYLRRLEAANAGLRRTNARLAREHLGHQDSAAASVVWKLQQAREAVEVRASELEAEIRRLEARLEQEVEIARRNDQYFQDARRMLQTRPHRVASGVERRLGRLPFARRFLR